MAEGNGATEVKVDELSTATMWEIVTEALRQVQETLDELKAQQAEIIEKLSNMTLDNDGFDVYE